MKEIKFRGWHFVEQRLIPPARIVSLFFGSDNGINEQIDDAPRYRFYGRKEVELSQYIGFKDCNGREIFEEDYVEYLNPEFNGRLIGLVTWEQGLVIKRLKIEEDMGELQEPENGFYREGAPLFKWADLKVIGNRYQDVLK